MNQTAVVFGATGMVGKELVYELLEGSEFVKVVAVVRNTLPLANGKLEQLKINDYSELSQYKEKLNAHVYFCCIGTTIKKAGSQEAFRKVDYDIPVQIAQLAKELSIPSLVIISSIGASATTSNFYLRTKGEMEQAVKDIYKGNLKIVRPSLLIGNRNEFRFGEKAATILMKAMGIFMFGPLRKYKGIYAWDVARAMIKSAHLPKDTVILESDKLADLGKKKK
ncbi:MAG TPA: NAD-dependent epimerase/dehydratase family protein [Bacteroidales bacterium]|nr:NAD-dependent epimerase/dehydratase family protein [Bacteroidales bacterium]